MANRSSSTKPNVVVRNIDELVKGLPKADKLLIHFTETQWAEITKDLKIGQELPKRGVIFAYTPLPDGTGGIGMGDCISGPCEICMSRFERIPDGFFGVECRCRRDPNCPPSIPTPSGSCRLVFKRQGFNWRMGCESIDCQAGNCQIKIVRDGVRSVIGCACQ
jgi:hypothetical protein